MEIDIPKSDIENRDKCLNRFYRILEKIKKIGKCQNGAVCNKIFTLYINAVNRYALVRNFRYTDLPALSVTFRNPKLSKR
jgi:hypothetical protein